VIALYPELVLVIIGITAASTLKYSRHPIPTAFEFVFFDTFKNLPRGEFFQVAENAFEWVLALGSDDQVNVVRHLAPGVHFQPLLLLTISYAFQKYIVVLLATEYVHPLHYRESDEMQLVLASDFVLGAH
jgi:hypothetical protein